MLKASRAPPTPANVQKYVDSLLKRGLYELAYYSWLQFLSPDRLARAGFITNGEFEDPPSGFPFDWTIARGVGVTVDLMPAEDRGGQRAMRIEFGEGRVDLGAISQITMLGPGDYTLKALVKGRLVGRRGLEWRISCAQGPQTIVGRSTAMSGTVARWTELEVRFSIPPEGCRAQRVHLILDARSASERIVSGTVWYDSLRITRRDQP
jgi:hypothetical protein